MSNPSSSFDDLLSSHIQIDGVSGTYTPAFDSPASESPSVHWREPGYTGEIDYRIRQLSYSSLLTLHSCPRKFQLYRLRAEKAPESNTSSITFAFGHVVGEGIQLALDNKSEEEIIWRMFLGWHTQTLLDSDEKSRKSFFYAVIAIQKFLSLRESGLLSDYELVYYDSKPACELSFAINFPDGFRLRGFVDGVLRHRYTGEVMVLEVKTTGSSALNPATYKNSSQAIGYSVVLDHLFPDLSSYQVLYLVYQTKSQEFTPIPFTKTYLQRALWIRELLLDIETIKMYEQAEVYPMRGESCLSFMRECEYLQTCTLSTPYLTKPCTPDQEDVTDYQVQISLSDLLDTQLSKVTE